MMSATTTDGVLLVDKPAGMTSHDVVGVARRALRERRIGHAGTLDPFATGLLVLAVGRATRLLPYVSGEPKVYDATIRLGAETDTDDLTGTVVRESPLPDDTALEAAIGALTGAIEQVPPAYSAKQVGGVRAHAAARAGAALELAPASVTVHQWEVQGRRGAEMDVRITCGGGTYIRALARDLGRISGSAAHLAGLRRVRSGAFDVRDAVSLDALREGACALLAPAAAVPELEVRRLTPGEVTRIAHGQRVPAGGVAGAFVALVDEAGALVGIASPHTGELQPRMVMHAG
jgi:tRNA pseudouridine55 synthase